MRQLEQEVKLEVSPGWALPDLSNALPGSTLTRLPTLRLEATYYDTASAHLAARHITLRYRRETEERRRANAAVRTAASARAGTSAIGTRTARTAYIWTIKLPSSVEGAVLTRTELSWTVGRPASRGSPLPPLVEAVELLAGVAMGEPLVPIAHLVTRRARTALRTSDGRPLAEVAHDLVSGTDLRHRGTRAAASPPVSFSEVEVELAEGASLEVLQALSAPLLESGARRSTRVSKLATVLQLSELPVSGQRPGLGRGTEKPEGPATMANVLQQQARTCLEGLLEHDIAIRLEDPDLEHVHRSRVATRRARSVLRAFKPLVGEQPWFERLRDELTWLGDALGAARDADVRAEALRQACAKMGKDDTEGSQSVLAIADEDRAHAHHELLQALQSERYLSCLRRLGALASPSARAAPTRASAVRAPVTARASAFTRRSARPPAAFWGALAEPASTAMPALASRQWRTLRKSVRRAQAQGTEPPEEQLHKVRIEAKRLRYVAEAAAGVLRARDRRAATATAKAATELQDILGTEHDASVNEQWLREVPVRVAAATSGRGRQRAVVAAALAAGQLVAMARDIQRTNRKAWQKAWRELDQAKLRSWLHLDGDLGPSPGAG